MLAITLFEALVPVWVLVFGIILAGLAWFVGSNSPLPALRRHDLRPPDEARFSAIGGLRFPLSSLGTFTATTPFARLSLHSTAVQIGPSTKVLRWLIPTWRVPYSQVDSVAAVRSAGTKGVRLIADGVPLVFLTGSPAGVLDALQAAGVTVHSGESRIGWWSLD